MELGGISLRLGQLTGAGGLAHPAEAASSQLISAGSSVRVLGSWARSGHGWVSRLGLVVRPLRQCLGQSLGSVQDLGKGSRLLQELLVDIYRRKGARRCS